MILKNVLINIPLPIQPNLHHHKIICLVLLILQNFFLSSHFFSLPHDPRQGKQVTYLFYKSKRGPKFSDLLKSTQLGRPGPKSQTPNSQSLLCILAQPCWHTSFCLPHFSLLGGPHSHLPVYLNFHQPILYDFNYPLHWKSSEILKEKNLFAYLSSILIHL